jgi:hypothetical protein
VRAANVRFEHLSPATYRGFSPLDRTQPNDSIR